MGPRKVNSEGRLRELRTGLQAGARQRPWLHQKTVGFVGPEDEQIVAATCLCRLVEAAQSVRVESILRNVFM
jgi:hypothetical protein